MNFNFLPVSLTVIELVLILLNVCEVGTYSCITVPVVDICDYNKSVKIYQISKHYN